MVCCWDGSCCKQCITTVAVQRPLVSASTSSSSCLHQSSSGLHLQHQHKQQSQSPRHSLVHTPLHSHSPRGAGEAAAEAPMAEAFEGPKQRLSWQHVLAEAWQSILALFLVYAVTLSLFPGVLAEDLKVSVRCLGGPPMSAQQSITSVLPFHHVRAPIDHPTLHHMTVLT